jgi:hypothetical protein
MKDRTVKWVQYVRRKVNERDEGEGTQLMDLKYIHEIEQ